MFTSERTLWENKMEKDIYIGQYTALMEKWTAKHDADKNGFAEDGMLFYLYTSRSNMARRRLKVS